VKNNSKADAAEELEKFQYFLFEMDDVLEPFVAAAQKAGFQLDYSIDSLMSLEQFLLAQPTAAGDSHLQNRAARYLGEVFRKNLGGKWELCLKDPKYLFYKLPVISGYSEMPIEFCPIEIIANFAGKKESGLLKRAVESHLEFKK
jgi:hypothetical protein